MATIYLRDNTSRRSCDFCGACPKTLIGTDEDSQRDLCWDCANIALNLFRTKSSYIDNVSRASSGSSGIAYSSQMDYKPKNDMNPVSLIAKKLLDKETRTLLKAGFLNQDLSISMQGSAALIAMMVEKYKKELVAEAEEVIAEEESEK